MSEVPDCGTGTSDWDPRTRSSMDWKPAAVVVLVVLGEGLKGRLAAIMR
jgi:hypothetical protein